MASKILWILVLLTIAQPAICTSSEPEAVQLLRDAAKPMPMAYTGRLIVLPEGAKTYKKVDVYYLPEGHFRRDFLSAKGTIVQSVIADGNSVWFYDRLRRAAWKGESQNGQEGHWPISSKELELLLKNYTVHLLPRATRIAKRPCRIIEIESPEGRLLQQVWLDQEHGLALEIKAYAPDGSLASSIRFIQLKFAPDISENLFHFSPPPGTEVIPSRKKPNYLDSKESMRGERSPTLPQWIPPGFELESSDIVLYGGTRVLHSRYSDGVQALSLFQCPEKVRLVPENTSTTRIKLSNDGRAELSEGVQWPKEGVGVRILQWRLHHRRFILVGRVPLEAMQKMAESLP